MLCIFSLSSHIDRMHIRARNKFKTNCKKFANIADDANFANFANLVNFAEFNAEVYIHAKSSSICKCKCKQIKSNDQKDCIKIAKSIVSWKKTYHYSQEW